MDQDEPPTNSAAGSQYETIVEGNHHHSDLVVQLSSSSLRIAESTSRTSAFLSPLENSTSMNQLCCVGEFMVDPSEDSNVDESEYNDGEPILDLAESIKFLKRKRIEKLILMKENLIRSRSRVKEAAKDWLIESKRDLTLAYRAQFPAWWLDLKKQLKDGLWDGVTPLPWFTESHLNELKTIFESMIGRSCDEDGDDDCSDIGAESEGNNARYEKPSDFGDSEEPEFTQAKRRKTGTEWRRTSEESHSSGVVANEDQREEEKLLKTSSVNNLETTQQQQTGDAVEPCSEPLDETNSSSNSNRIDDAGVDIELAENNDDEQECMTDDWNHRPSSPPVIARSSVVDAATMANWNAL